MVSICGGFELSRSAWLFHFGLMHQNGDQVVRDGVTVIKQVTRIIRKAGLDYEAWRYVAKRVRKQCDLKPKKAGRKLPRILTADDFRNPRAIPPDCHLRCVLMAIVIGL